MNRDSELVIGIVHTVGTVSSEIIECMIDSLNKFHYKSEIIKVSKEILSPFASVPPNFTDEHERISFFMDKGNEIRKKTGDDAILMKGVCAFIYGKYRLGRNEGPQLRKAYIIDSIKHPDEVEFLRRTYGDGFHLVGISDDYARRKSYLMDRKNLSEQQAIDILNRDDNEKEKNGQHTRDAYQQADLSRQIGVVVTKDDEILAEGVNDCPKAFGGLYWSLFKEGKFIDVQEGRDYTLGYDSNKIEQQKMIDSILTELELECNDENTKKIKSAGIGSLTEFGRVVHGEMEALMMCARNGISTKGCSMYMTTFPCHNCAKHIIAAGIEKVVYIEPYPKSKALDFYKIEISQDRKDIRKKVVFMPFKGVGPHRFVDLFSMQSIRWYARTRKQTNGYVVDWERNTANLRNPMALLNYIDMEKSAYNQYAEEITGIGKEDENECEKNNEA